MLNFEQWKAAWLAEEQREFEGWDFSALEGRQTEEPLPWDYIAVVNHYRRPADQLLDMGTGGGELLLKLRHPYARTAVTEAYPPNLALCRHRLAPLGIEVRAVTSDYELPFADHSFDLIINRHESFAIPEVHRLLKPNGLFITQQVGELNNRRLSERLIPGFKGILPDRHDLKSNAGRLRESGFELLEQDEYFPYLRFHDIGALVYLAKIVRWEFPGFSVERCFDTLCQLQQIVERDGYLESTEHRFLIVARKTV